MDENTSLSGIVVEGHAIVSRDGMIADAEGGMPAGLHNDEDWRRFQAALDSAVLVVLGRLGHERHPNAGRRRLVATGGVETLAPDPADRLATFWNPAGLSFADALARLGIRRGIVAVTGGTRLFDLLLPRFDRFVLSTATRVELPGGRPCFSAGEPVAVLASSGLVPGPEEVLDAPAGVVATVWEKPGSRPRVP